MDPIAETARWAAAARARETARPDRLLEDPWADGLAGKRDSSGSASDDTSVVIRTRFFDEFVLDSAVGTIRQIVLVGAGLDTRAFRLPWPDGTRLYELDRPEMLELKGQSLDAVGAHPACMRRTVGVDLAQSGWTSALEEAGFRRDLPSCWLAEGLVVYLGEDWVNALLRQLSRLAVPGSRLGLDVPNLAFFQSPWTRPIMDMMENRGTRYRFGTDEPEALLAKLDWVASATMLSHEAAKHGRCPYPSAPRGVSGMLDGFLVTATRLGTFK